MSFLQIEASRIWKKMFVQYSYQHYLGKIKRLALQIQAKILLIWMNIAVFKCNLSIGAFWLGIYFSNLTFSYDVVRQVPILLSLDSIGDADVLLGQMPCLLATSPLHSENTDKISWKRRGINKIKVT